MRGAGAGMVLGWIRSAGAERFPPARVSRLLPRRLPHSAPIAVLPVKKAAIASVAQIFNLPYRRFSIGRARAFLAHPAFPRSLGLRYNGLKICAITLKRRGTKK